MDLLTHIQTHSFTLLDGAMGTQLDKRGLMSRGRNNLDAPEAVLEIHREYAACGCDALTTNTLTMNRIYIETHNVGVDVREVNLAGARLAREAAAEGQFVLGDMCSTGQLLEPYGDYTESQFHDAFKEQVEILAEGGVDAYIIETMFDLREALVALRACKDIAPLPVIVTMAFAATASGGRTMMGDTAEDCAKRLTEAGADAIGANCGDLDPYQMAEVVSMLQSAASVPIVAQANAGKPRLVGDQAVFDMGPEPWAAGMLECARSGARIVGGCCGTSPDHIRALARRLGDRKGVG